MAEHIYKEVSEHLYGLWGARDEFRSWLEMYENHEEYPEDPAYADSSG